MRCREIAVALAAGALLCAGPAGAEHTRNWRQSEYSDFERGTAKGVALRSDGKIMPAPKFSTYSDPNLAYVWTLGTDSKGRVYAAGGTNAQVLRLDDPAKPTKVFESSELAAQAIAFDAKDNLYVGTSPDGKVYKVTPDGQKSVVLDPKAKYIWAIAVDSQGDVFVGTGDEGKVFVIGPDGKSQLFYQSDERHARSLAFDAKGNLLIGTDPDGLILRIELKRKSAQATPDAGSSFVLYETNKKEVTSLLVDATGNIYAGAIGEKQRAAGGVPVPSSIQVLAAQAAAAASTAQAAVQAGIQAQTTAVAPSFPFFPSTSGGSEVDRIGPDGSPETIWTGREELIFSMGFSPQGKLLLGTGNKGTIIELEGNDVFSTVAKTESSQVMSLARGADGRIFVATANPGKIFSMGPGYDPEGSFESDTFDAQIFSQWGRLTWWGENGAMQGKVAFYVRSGNTSSPEKNWSPWAGPYKTPSTDKVDCPPARFAQWKAVFLDTDHGGAPSITWVNLAYLPKNVAPEVDDIAIQDPNVRVQSFGAAGGVPGAPQPVQLRQPQRQSSQSAFSASFAMQQASEQAGRSTKADVVPQGFVERGYQSVLWSAHDDNDDDLTYTIYYRGEGEQNWRLLKGKITQKFYSWDSTTMPDGAYYLKIVASDEPSNPPDQKLTGERESDRFVIANTPPEISTLRAEANGEGAEVTFTASSSSGAVARALYSVDGGDWTVVFPIGELSDAPKESYQFEIHPLAPGEHTIAVQVADAYENTTAAKVTFSVKAVAK